MRKLVRLFHTQIRNILDIEIGVHWTFIKLTILTFTESLIWNFWLVQYGTTSFFFLYFWVFVLLHDRLRFLNIISYLSQLLFIVFLGHNYLIGLIFRLRFQLQLINDHLCFWLLSFCSKWHVRLCTIALDNFRLFYQSLL